MTLAQASVGAAATSPTSGTALMTPELTRHGAANRPQPASAAVIASKRPSRASIAITANETLPRRKSSQRRRRSQISYGFSRRLAGGENVDGQIGGLFGKQARFGAP